MTAEQAALYVIHGGRLEQPQPHCDPVTYGIMSDCWRRRATARPTAASLVERLSELRAAAATARRPLPDWPDAARRRAARGTVDAGAATRTPQIPRSNRSNNKADESAAFRSELSAINRLSARFSALFDSTGTGSGRPPLPPVSGGGVGLVTSSSSDLSVTVPLSHSVDDVETAAATTVGSGTRPHLNRFKSFRKLMAGSYARKKPKQRTASTTDGAASKTTHIPGDLTT
jgi:hypothetical protein